MTSRPVQIRREYGATALRRKDLNPNPIWQFETWFEEATKEGVADANAMVLATTDGNGVPSARVVLLKGIDADGFVFFTNLGSRKSVEIEQNPNVALVFYWPALERQVRVGGRAERIPEQSSDEYFATRPRESQIAAWASEQSAALESRDALEKSFRDYTARFQAQTIPRPKHWGGLRVVPETMEFWQGRANRLHDRFMYRRVGDLWNITRLSP